MSCSDGERRPPIPAEIRRRVLVEAGHRCAIPTCRYIEVDIHHIIQWAKCQAHEYDNLIALCPNCHRRADKGEIDRKSLRLYKANLRFAHDKFSQVEIDVLFEVAKLPQGQGAQWPAFNMLLIKRLLDAGYLHVQQPQGGVFIGGMQSAPCLLTISEKGKAFIDELDLHEL
ncbi:HNH endonuclease [Pseudohoeflea coraliihabitans]|uniref:HNH endonuclease n=1 Tax=Pseudohoeflea coraliihabitans TaxID=2860393 RepID=A0ABS6WT81_9HYPH|nr:HNH endonuclease signature motif containing protein [Pseudohoeflea sp. DP4N28-3]MBW3099163.1 HNH endonuclease [Pseudohoeflea sp. DP4N28-3]